MNSINDLPVWMDIGVVSGVVGASESAGRHSLKIGSGEHDSAGMLRQAVMMLYRLSRFKLSMALMLRTRAGPAFWRCYRVVAFLICLHGLACPPAGLIAALSCQGRGRAYTNPGL